jgi:tetratricopeptide (TPR) repeat protein
MRLLARLRRVAAPAVAVAFLALVVGTARAEDDVAAAEALLAKGDAPAAATAFRRLAEAPGGDADARVQSGLGTSLLFDADPVSAIEPLSAAVRLRADPLDRLRLAQSLVGAARLAIERSATRTIGPVPYLNDAIAQVEAARGKSPATAAPLALVEAEARSLLGDLAGARAALAAPGLEKDATVAVKAAEYAFLAKDYAAAADAYAKAGYPRGVAASWAAGKDPRAVKAYVDLVRAAPDDAALLEEALGASVAVGDDRGLDAGLAALDAKGDLRIAVLRARGRLAELAKRSADAVPHYREVAATKPGDADAERDLARALLNGSPGDPAAVEEAVAHMLAVLRLVPDDDWTRRALDWQAARDGDAAPRDWPDRTRMDRSVRLFLALAETDPTDGLRWSQLGNARRNAGDARGAVAAFDRAVEANPHDAVAWNDRGLALLAAGEDEKALESFDRAIAIDSKDPSPRQNGGRVRWL